MNDPETVSKSRFQQLIHSPVRDEDVSGENTTDTDYMWRGGRFRVVPMRQAPLMQFRLTLGPHESLQFKYAYITHQTFIQQNDQNQNEIVVIIRDSTRISIRGLNLWQLDDCLLMQRVLEIQTVSELQAAAAIKRGEESSIIMQVTLEYGRFDIENRIWLRGSGYWCERQKRWISEVAMPSQEETVDDS